MAKDDQREGNALLGNIVAQLRQLNRATVKDKLRDAEALKRAEALAASQVVQAQESGALVTDAQDFQRRFLAGQARTEFNTAIKDRPAKLYAQQSLIRRSDIQIEYLKGIEAMNTQSVIENYHFLNEIEGLAKAAAVARRGLFNEFTKNSGRGSATGMPTGGSGTGEEGAPAGVDEGPSIKLVKVNTDALVQKQSFGNAVRRQMLDLMKQDKEGIDQSALVESVEKIRSINSKMLAFMKQDKKDRKKQFNTAQRNAREARQEAINNSGRGSASGTGMPTGSGAEDDDGSGGGFFAFLKGKAGIAGGTALTGLALFRKWFGFGSKRGFLRTMKLRFKLAGKKMFPKSKMKLSKNPRMWPILLVGIIASSFADSSSAAVDEFSAEQSDTADASGAGSTPDGSGESILTFNNALNAALIATMLPIKTMRTRVAAGLKIGLAKLFKGAPKGSLRAKMWAQMKKPTNWGKASRGFLRAFGPWGMAAWAVSEIVIWRINSVRKQQEENESLMADMNAVDNEASAADFMENVDMSKFVFKEQKSMMLANPNTKQKNNVKMLLQTVAKNKAAQEVYIQELMKQGWDETTLRGMAAQINNPSTTLTPLSSLNTEHPAWKKKQKLLEEKKRAEMMGGLSLFTKDYAPMDVMDDSIQYGTGVGIYGDQGDQIMGGAITTVNNIVNETIFITPAKENRHHMAKGPR